MTWYESPVKYGVLTSFLFVVLACSSGKDNDQPATLNPNPLGPGARLRDVQNPANAQAGRSVSVTSVIVTTVDTFDETHDGKSRGTIFVQDADIAGPFAGISMYAPTFVPANLRLAPGDVVQLDGQYTEEHTIGTTVNFGTSFLPQMSKPQVHQEFEMTLPAPIPVNITDLQDFSTARKWMGTLVTLLDVTVTNAPAPSDGKGRVTAALTTNTTGPFVNNELWDLQAWTGTNGSNSFAAGTHFKSITGIVDFFFNIYVCPRSAADLVQ